jgi:hypothetical protein
VDELPERPADPEAIPSLAEFHEENIGIMLRTVAEQRARDFPRRDHAPERNGDLDRDSHDGCDLCAALRKKGQHEH